MKNNRLDETKIGNAKKGNSRYSTKRILYSKC